MNSLERNCGEAIVAVLNTEATLAAIPPTVWDEVAELPFPRCVVKVKQGGELVHLHGVYRINCQIEMAAEATARIVDDFKAIVARLILDNQAPAVLPGDLAPIHELLTNSHFHCFGVEPGGSSMNNSTENRIMTITFDAIGFDIDRHS